MRIAFFLLRFPVLSQTFILNQITSMIDAGHEVRIFAKRRGLESKHHADVERYRLLEKTTFLTQSKTDTWNRCVEMWQLIGKRKIWKLRRSLLEALFENAKKRLRLNTGFLHQVLVLAGCGKFDIIHCQFGVIAPAVLRFKELGLIDGKLVTSFRGYDITRVHRREPRYYVDLFREGSLFLPVSDSLKQRLLLAGCPPERIVVLHSGIDCKRFEYREAPERGSRATRLISIGRLVEKKGFDQVIDAVERVSKAGEDVEYSLVGDGELRESLERKALDLGLEEKVHFCGLRDQREIARLLFESDILIAPSITAVDGTEEGIPNVMKEAMATGLPVLGTMHGGIPELVENGVSGYLVPEGDLDALEDRLLHLCTHPEKWASMGKKGREKVLSEFDAAKVNRDLEMLYERVGKL